MIRTNCKSCGRFVWLQDTPIVIQATADVDVDSFDGVLCDTCEEIMRDTGYGDFGPM